MRVLAISCNILGFATCSSGCADVPVNFMLGTQSIYGPTWESYSFTDKDILTEQVDRIVAMGGNQLKIRLAKDTTCSGYRLNCDQSVSSLTALSRVKEVASAFSSPRIFWYQIWLSSFSNQNFLKTGWTEAKLAQEYAETKAWALDILRTYSGTGKVFMAGNWEGDWMLMGASGCRTEDKFDKNCDPTPEVMDRMVQWGQRRQQAIDDARTEANVQNVWLYYYMEMNLGPQALAGKPGVTNNVLEHVNPDLVSYSSYSTTNAFATDADAAEKQFFAVLDHIKSKLPTKDTATIRSLGFQERVFIGEFGAKPHSSPTEFDVNRFVARVTSASLRWGASFVLYWELYSTYNTVPIIPPDGSTTALQVLFQKYYSAAREFAQSSPGPAEMRAWAADYFAVASAGCTFQPYTGFASDGYAYEATSTQDCCDLCAQDPTCAVGVHLGDKCYMKFHATGKKIGSGTACVKRTRLV